MELKIVAREGEEITFRIRPGSLTDRGTPGSDIPGIANTVRRRQYACTPELVPDIEKIRRCDGVLSVTPEEKFKVRVHGFTNGQLILESLD